MFHFNVYNVQLLSVKSAFLNNFVISFSLIKLMTRLQLEPSMFKTAISVRFIDIINHDICCRHFVETII